MAVSTVIVQHVGWLDLRFNYTLKVWFEEKRVGPCYPIPDREQHEADEISHRRARCRDGMPCSFKYHSTSSGCSSLGQQRLVIILPSVSRSVEDKDTRTVLRMG